MNNIIKSTVGGVMVFSLGILGATTDTFQSVIGWSKSVEEKASRDTSLEKSVETMQREIDRLRNDNNQTQKNAAAIERLYKAIDAIKVSGKPENSIKLEQQFSQLQKQISDLEIKLKSITNNSANDISNTALTIAVNRALEGAKSDLLAEVEASTERLLENMLTTLPTSNENSIPIATKRRIHFVEKDCVYLPSFPSQFTLKFKKATEFCWNPSVLWFDISYLDNRNFNVRYIGGDTYQCSSGNVCYIGSDDDGNRYKVKIENSYVKEGIQFLEVNFQKVG